MNQYIGLQFEEAKIIMFEVLKVLNHAFEILVDWYKSETIDDKTESLIFFFKKKKIKIPKNENNRRK